MKKNRVFIILGIILIIGAFLRFYKLDMIPVGFHIDEASLGYNAYSLLTTGKDDNGNSFPLYIDMFGDNRPSGYHIISIIPVAMFGLTEFATRFQAALFGTLGSVAIFLFAQALFKSTKVSLLSALLFAIAPWNVVLSRASGEAVVAVFFILLGFANIVYGFQTQKSRYPLLGALFLSFSFFFYHTPRVFVPLVYLFILGYLFPVWFKAKSRQFRISQIISFLVVSLIALFLVFVISGGTGRFSQVNIFSAPETGLVMAEQIREDGTMGTRVAITRMFHNKGIDYSYTFLKNYFLYFTGEFLFVKGGLPSWYVVPQMGLLYVIELPFILLGAVYLFLSNKRIYKIPLLWILIAPVTAAVTVDDIPNINRASVMFPMLHIIGGFGFITLVQNLNKIRRIFAIGGIGVILLFSFMYFVHQYFVHAQIHRTWYRNNGFKEMILELNEGYDKTDKIVVTKSLGSIYPLILFYSKYDPNIYQAEGSTKDEVYTGFGKYYFVPQECPLINKDERFPKDENIIYVNAGSCPDLKARKVPTSEIYREDGTKVFRLMYD